MANDGPRPDGVLEGHT